MFFQFCDASYCYRQTPLALFISSVIIIIFYPHLHISIIIIIMAALSIGQAIIFLPCVFYLLFSWPILRGRRLNVYHTSTHGVVLMRI